MRIRMSDKKAASYPFKANIRSVRVFGNYVYVAGKQDSTEGIWRFPFVGIDSVGTPELFFSISSVYGVGKASVYAITFNSAGDLYAGTDAADAVLIIHPTGASEPLYPGLIVPQPISFAWTSGTDPFLYFSRSGSTNSHTLIRVNTATTSAPNYGVQ